MVFCLIVKKACIFTLYLEVKAGGQSFRGDPQESTRPGLCLPSHPARPVLWPGPREHPTGREQESQGVSPELTEFPSRNEQCEGPCSDRAVGGLPGDVKTLQPEKMTDAYLLHITSPS